MKKALPPSLAGHNDKPRSGVTPSSTTHKAVPPQLRTESDPRQRRKCAALYAIVPSSAPNSPPKPIFSYSSAVPSGTAVTSVHVPFSSNSDVTWNWSPQKSTWLRFYNGTQPDLNADGVQNAAANVIIQTVNVTYGPWLENSEGGLEVQAQLSGTSGPAMVFRNGVEISGTWSRASNASPTVFTSSTGKVITMAPGRSWIELVPSGVAVTPTPATPSASSTTAAG